MRKLYFLLALIAAPFFINAQTLEICGADVPPGWISIAVKPSYCGINGSYRYIGRTIMRIDGLAPGTVLNICGSDVPDGWISIGVNSKYCTQLGSNSYIGKTIKKIEGLPTGTTLDICGSNVPDGWVSIAVKSSYCTQIGPYSFIGKTIRKIEGAAPGTVLDICGSDVPTGWVSTAVKSSYCKQVGSYSFIGKTIKKVEGMPIGTVINVCGSDAPQGWIRTSVSGSCAKVGAFNFTGATIQKISGMVTQTIALDPIPVLTYGSADYAPVASATSGLPVSLSSSNPLVAGIVNGKIKVYGAGTTFITVSQAGNNAYTSAPEISQLVTVNKANQFISFPVVTPKSPSSPDFDPGATSSSSLPVTYTSTNKQVATIVAGKVHIVGIGTTNIAANQAGNGNFNPAGYFAHVLTVTKNNQTITFAPLPIKSTGDANFSPGATASSGLAVTYTSSNTAVATIVSQKISIIGVGTSTITASQSGNGDYNAAPSITQLLTIKSPQTITFKPLSAKSYGASDFVPAAAASSGLTVTFASSNAGVATMVNGKIHITGVGITTIVASQKGNGSFAAATAVPQQLTVNKGPQAITFKPIPSKVIGTADFAPGATASSALTVNYTSSNTTVATIVSGKIHLLKAGATTITATQAGNALYNVAPNVAQELTVTKASQVITFKAIPAKLASTLDFDPGAKASSGLEVSYTSSNTAVATIVGGKIHVIKQGTSTIHATQDGNSAYLGAVPVSQLLTVNKADQTITFKPIPEKPATAADFTPNASATSQLPIAFASSNTSVATILNGKIHIVGAGVSTITASQAGNTAFGAAKNVIQLLTVVKVGQKIYFPVISVKAHGVSDFDPAAKASSGLPVTYKSSNTTVATIVNGKVHILKVGEAIITASQKGDNVYEPASPASQALTVGQAAQTITFNAIPEKLVGAPDFDLVATSSSGLKVIYTSSNTAVAKIVNGRVRILKSGLTNIVASQPGNLTYKPAPTVSRPLVVKKNKQTITFNAIPSKVVGSPDFNPGATASSGLSVTYASSATVVATIVNGKVHIIKNGSSIITASQAGDDFYEAATIKSQKLVINKPGVAPELFTPASVEDTSEIVSVTESPVREIVKTSDVNLEIKPGELVYKVYPNPASRQIIIENEIGPDSRGVFEDKVWIRIYNSRGLLEKEVKTNTEKVTIPIENIPEGSYVIRITNGKKELTKHILIRH